MKYTVKADIWALGCLLWELVTGAKAFRGDIDVFLHYRNGTPHSLPDLREDVGGSRMEALIHRLLDLNEANRPSAKGFVDQLHSLASVAVSSEAGMEPVAPHRTMETDESSSQAVRSNREPRDQNTPLIQITGAPESASPSHPSPWSFTSQGKDEQESTPPFEEQRPNEEITISIEANQPKSPRAELSGEQPKTTPLNSFEEQVRFSVPETHKSGITQDPDNEANTSAVRSTKRANTQSGVAPLSIGKRKKIQLLDRIKGIEWVRKLTKK